MDGDADKATCLGCVDRKTPANIWRLEPYKNVWNR